MNKFIISFCLIVFACLASCAPHKDSLYLQDKHEINTNDNEIQTLTEKQKPYRIQINDILNIRVKASDQNLVRILNPTGDESLNASGPERAYFDGFTVDLHGQIRIPTLGKISVLGYTTEEIGQLIEKRLLEEEFKEKAEIFVTVKLSGFRFTVNGEVGSPGSQILFQDRVNIFEAIANAGEIPPTGNKKDVLIIRQYPQGQKIHHIDLTDAKILESPFYYLQPNDLISVKPLKQPFFGSRANGLQTVTTVVSLISLVATTILLIDRF